MSALRLEKSRPGFVWLGGKRIGKVCERAYDGGPNDPDREARVAAADLSRAVMWLCAAVRNVHAGSFDCRRTPHHQVRESARQFAFVWTERLGQVTP